ncbi:glycosyltransferase family 4 protein [Propionicicella superfundia]|uniref:glycosyltransferase family 4 protein n=1 Tax=Propionicicella superfundia TaxID=348582 RepID=UPI0003FB8C0E|nr:glycosyltransferase family 4 protein [Propionicicella superfundia]
MTNVYHVITPGDHYSPRTGSAIPTVVHGLSTGAAIAGDADRYPPHIVLQDDTFRPRYESARPVEYAGVPAPNARERYTDAALGLLGVPRSGNVRYYTPVAQRLAAEPAGIVLAHNATIMPWLLRDSDHAVMLYAHNDLLRSYSRREATRVVGGAERLICVSESLAAQHRDHLPASLHDRIRVVGNGVDADHFHPAATREPGPLRVLFIGRVLPIKGPDILLTAAGMVERDDIEYTIVGSSTFARDAPLSDYEKELRALAEQAHGTVTFQPFVPRPDLPAVLQRADILVLPSRWPDPCPLTVGESMATGLPIVAARMGGIPESLGDAGILFDPEQPAELAAAIERLAADEEHRHALGAAARARALAHDWTWSWRRLAAVLDEIDVP